MDAYPTRNGSLILNDFGKYHPAAEADRSRVSFGVLYTLNMHKYPLGMWWKKHELILNTKLKVNECMVQYPNFRYFTQWQETKLHGSSTSNPVSNKGFHSFSSDHAGLWKLADKNGVLKFNIKSLATKRNKASATSVMSKPPNKKTLQWKHVWLIEKPEQITNWCVFFSPSCPKPKKKDKPSHFRSSYAPVGLLLRRCWQRTSLLQVGLLCILAGSLTLRPFGPRMNWNWIGRYTPQKTNMSCRRPFQKEGSLSTTILQRTC